MNTPWLVPNSTAPTPVRTARANGRLWFCIALCSIVGRAWGADYAPLTPLAPLPAGEIIAEPVRPNETPAPPIVPPGGNAWQRYPAPGTGPLVQSTWYTRIEYFHWNERVDGEDFVNEDGALWTLGYQRQIGRERFRAELFGTQAQYTGEVQYNDGSTEPLSSVTNYLGVRAEYDLLFEPDWCPRVTFITGVGTRFWFRDLPDDFTASGTLVSGYQETWWTVYPYIGIEKRRTFQTDAEFYGSARIGVTAINYENVTVDDVRLYPRPGLTSRLEYGIRGPRYFVAATLELMTWQKSAEVRGWLQPTSQMFTAGLRTGFSF